MPGVKFGMASNAVRAAPSLTGPNFAASAFVP
jgi:hypothetical protein